MPPAQKAADAGHSQQVESRQALCGIDRIGGCVGQRDQLARTPLTSNWRSNDCPFANVM